MYLQFRKYTVTVIYTIARVIRKIGIERFYYKILPGSRLSEYCEKFLVNIWYGDREG